MYKIEKTHYGIRLTFGDMIKVEEMRQWAEEFKKVVAESPKQFGVFVDMRTLRPLPKDSQEAMEDGQKAAKQAGMQRSVVILSSSLIKMQFTRIGKQTGIYDWERYIDASSEPNWEKVGEAWITDAKDPDL
jgi:hypothetical protein